MRWILLYNNYTNIDILNVHNPTDYQLNRGLVARAESTFDTKNEDYDYTAFEYYYKDLNCQNLQAL